MKFSAEIKQVQSKKTTSYYITNDLEFKIVFVSNDPGVLALGAMSPDQLVNVEVTPNA